MWTVTSFENSWWWLFGVVVTAAVIAVVFATPYVLVPLFFKMQPLTDESTAERIRALVRRANAEIHDVCSLDFSRRTAEANAAVIGIGRSRRVVLADTLLQDFRPAEVDAVVAHELGHHVHRDVPRLLLGQLALMWVGLFFAARLAPSALPLLSVPYLGYVPAYGVLFALAEAFLLLASPLTNWWSRRLEAAADRFAFAFDPGPGRVRDRDASSRRPEPDRAPPAALGRSTAGQPPGAVPANRPRRRLAQRTDDRPRPVGPPPLSLRLAAVLSVPLLLYALFATGQKALDNYRLNREADALRAEIVALRSDNLALQDDIVRSRTDTAIEAIAREEQLGLVNPGDNAVVLLQNGASRRATTRHRRHPPPPLRHGPIWREWWAYFFRTRGVGLCSLRSRAWGLVMA